MTIILAIFVSPVASTQWAVGQQGNQTNVGEPVGGADSAAGQTSVVGDGANVDSNGGTVQESPIDDGSNEDGANIGSSTSQQETSIEDEADLHSNQEPSSVVEDGIAIDDSDDGTDGYSVKREDAAAIREWAVQKKLALKEFDRSNLVANSTQILSSLRDKSIENSKSTNNEDATTHSPTESTSQDRFSNSSLSRQYNDGRIKLESAQTQLQEITNQTISTLNQQSSFPTESPVFPNQSATQNVLSTSNQNSTQVSSSQTEQSAIEPVMDALLTNISLPVTLNETSTSSSIPLPNNSSTSLSNQMVGNISSLPTNSLPADSSVENSTLLSSSVSQASPIKGDYPGSIKVPVTGNGSIVSLRDIGNTNNATGEITFDKKEYFMGDSPKITVKDDEANLVPNEIEFVTAFVSSDTSQPFSIRVDLEETGPNTGIFEGSFTLISGPSFGNTLQVNGTDIITVNYVISHARVNVKIDGFPGPGYHYPGYECCVTGPTAFEIFDTLVPIAADSGIETGIGFEIHVSCIDFSACGSNSLLPNSVCVENNIPNSEFLCEGIKTIEISYANALLGGHSPADLTIWQDLRGSAVPPMDKWVDLGDFGEVIVNENAKTITATSPFVVGGTFAIGVKISGGGGTNGAQTFPSAECVLPEDPSGGGGGGGGGLFGGLICQRVPGGLQQLFATAKDPVVPVLNPLLPRITPGAITPVRSDVERLGSLTQENDDNDDTQINVLPTALAASNNCDTNDALLANYSSINCPTGNSTMDESVLTNTKLGIINASSFNQEGVIWVDADVQNLIVEIRPEPKRQDVVIVEGTNLVWVNSGEVKQGIRVLENSTGEKVFSDLSVPSGNFTSFKFMKPGLYEYSNLVDPNISNTGTVQVVSKGEGVDNLSTNATTRTVGVTIVPIKEVTSFLSNLNTTASLVLSSTRALSSAEAFYVWSNEAAVPDSILAKLGHISTNQ